MDEDGKTGRGGLCLSSLPMDSFLHPHIQPYEKKSYWMSSLHVLRGTLWTLRFLLKCPLQMVIRVIDRAWCKGHGLVALTPQKALWGV
jgi:hypothetical protein